jgi:hypothetical protein
MSEYQYYGFCRISGPLSAEARREMKSLSSRASVGTHTASYVYNFGDFRGQPLDLLLKHFDMFLYLSNFGTVRLIFKYLRKDIDLPEIENHCVEDLIDCDEDGPFIWLDVCLDEKCFNPSDGDDVLPELLPVYEALRRGDYQFLKLVKLLHEDQIEEIKELSLSSAEKAFLACCDEECF